MTLELRKVNEEGIKRFEAYLDAGASGPPPVHLLSSPETSEKLATSILPSRHEFKDRYDFGSYLNDLLKNLDPVSISRDRGLWTALAIIWFDLICPPDKTGVRKVNMHYQYILESSYQTYYRHLVRSPWQCVKDHGENAKFMLIRSKDVEHPLSVHGEILEQFGGRQRLFGSRAIIRAANMMYLDSETGRPLKGASGSGAGSALRFGKVVRQLDLTFDPDSMTPAEFINILPKEFSKWKGIAGGTNQNSVSSAAE
jgi:hypothetical protein